MVRIFDPRKGLLLQLPAPIYVENETDVLATGIAVGGSSWHGRVGVETGETIASAKFGAQTAFFPALPWEPVGASAAECPVCLRRPYQQAFSSAAGRVLPSQMPFQLTLVANERLPSGPLPNVTRPHG